MKKPFTLLPVFFFSTFYVASLAQTYPGVAWDAAWGTNYSDCVKGAMLTGDNGFIVVGGGYDEVQEYFAYSFIVRFDSNGNALDSLIDPFNTYVIESIRPASDGNYIISASKDAPVIFQDCYVAKLDTGLEVIWEKELYFGSGESSNAIPTQGGYLFAGSVYADIPPDNSDILLVKFDEEGNQLWMDTIGGSADDWFTDIIDLEADGFLLTTTTSSNDGDISGNHGGTDIWLVKLDADGNITWQKCLGGSDHEGNAQVLSTAANKYLVGGNTNSNEGDVSGNHGGNDIWLTEIDGDGNLLWQHTYGGSNYENLTDLDMLSNGNLVITGYSYSKNGDVSGNHGAADTWIFLTDTSGNMIWNRCYGGDFNESAGQLLVVDDSTYYSINISTSEFSGDVNEDCLYTFDDDGNPIFNGDVWMMKLTHHPVPCATGAGFGYSNKCTSFTFSNTSYFSNSFLWDFGDGTFSTAANPVHSYDTLGNYTACLIAGDGCSSDTFCQSFLTYNDLIADFEYDQAGLTFSFFDYYALYPFLSQPAQWFWDFGDGITDTIQTPFHTYPNNGFYTVSLEVVDSCGYSNYYNEEISTCISFNGNFIYQSMNCHDYSFSPFSSTLNLISSQWDFGDGTTDTALYANHHFNDSGSYHVCFTTSDSCTTKTYCQFVEVGDSVDAGFNYTSNGLAFNFYNTSENNLYSNWEFGDASGPSSLENPTHAYATPGQYTVCIYGYNSCSFDADCKVVNAFPVGISDINDEVSVQVYPNPAHDKVYLTFILVETSEISITVTDMWNRVVKKEIKQSLAPGNNTLIIDTRNLSPGIYFLQLTTTDGIVSGKLIIQ